ncbi:MAG: hypothetical protein ABJL72_10310 [Roseobacter sp.]
MDTTHPLLRRRPTRNIPAIPLLPTNTEITLAQGRVHETSGPARRTFAAWLAAQTKGAIFWISPHWTQDQLNTDGLSDWIDPARLILVSPKRQEDLLWTMEEVLRAGAVALSIVDLPGIPTLTQVRRMHLAAEAGGQSGACLPLGLLLTPGRGGAAGVETRWHLQPRHANGQNNWQLERLRARTAPRKNWTIEHPLNGSLSHISK